MEAEWQQFLTMFRECFQGEFPAEFESLIESTWFAAAITTAGIIHKEKKDPCVLMVECIHHLQSQQNGFAEYYKPSDN